MDSIVVRSSMAKRIIVTLLPAICFLGMYLCAAVSVNFLEYGSKADKIMGNIMLSLLIPMIVSIPFIFKVHREKTVFDGYTFVVTPFIGQKKTISLQDVKVCTIDKRKQIRLFDKNSNLICKYSETEDREKMILLALQRSGKSVFTFRIRNEKQIVAKGSDKIFLKYLATGKIVTPEDELRAFNKMSREEKVKYMLEEYEDELGDTEEDEDVLDDENVQELTYMRKYGFKEMPYAEGEINEKIQNRLRKNVKRALVGQIICILLFILGIILIANNVQGKIIQCIAMILFFGSNIVILVIECYRRRKEFEIVKTTFYRVNATAVDEKNFSAKSSEVDRHLIYEFQDKYGAKRHRPSDRVNTADIAWGTGIGEKKVLWYSPYEEYLLETEPVKFKLIRSKKRPSFKVWIKRHPILVVGCVAIIASAIFGLYQFGERQVFIYTNDGRKLQVEWSAKGGTTEEQATAAVEATGMEKEELEAWLKQSFYPYFYANDASDEEFEEFDVEEYKNILDEEMIQKIKDNLSSSWGINDRKSLIKKTDSLLKKGDKYTYARTLEKMSEEVMNLPEDTIFYTYRLYEPDEFYRYLGTYYAYNEIGDAGVDAWDYCRCIRLFAFGYISGYISYDEYLIHAAPIVTYLQNEYDSWTKMYESYYYGHLIFLGRNEYTSVIAKYDGYSDYSEMGENVEMPFRNE
ncbi:MAG: DUF1266 domain-containing protein [Roseburia sp.]